MVAIYLCYFFATLLAWAIPGICVVDSTRIRHSVEVAAESLYEAAALAVYEFRSYPAWMMWNLAPSSRRP